MFDGLRVQKCKLSIHRNRLRAYCWLRFDPGTEIDERCIIDTGAEYSVIPQRIWEKFSSIIKPKSLQTTSLRGVCGRPLPALIGWLELSVSGTENDADEPLNLGLCEVRYALDKDAAINDRGRALEPGETEDSRLREMQHVLLGLGGGTMKNGGLCINWTLPEAHLITIEN